MHLRVAAFVSLFVMASTSGAAAGAGTFNWSGFYLGGHLGHAFGTLTTNNSSVFTDGTVFGVPGAYNPPQVFGGDDSSGDFDGFFGGAQAGYNAAFNHLVVGIETDIDWSGIETSSRFLGSDQGPTYDTSGRLDWFGTLRLRGGLTVDRLLIYATAGLAYGGGSGGLTITPGVPGNFVADPFSATGRRTYVGYAVGAGAELALGRNVTARLEYLYMDLGEQDYEFPLPNSNGSIAYSTNGVTENLIRAGLNYKF